MFDKCPACGDDAQQRNIGELFGRSETVRRCEACGRLYLVGLAVPPTLSEQDRRLLQLTVMGHTNKRIASLMDISLRTVHLRRVGLMKKLGVQNRVELVRRAVELRLCN